MPVIVWGGKAGPLRTGNTYRTDTGEGPTTKEEQARSSGGREMGTGGWGWGEGRPVRSDGAELSQLAVSLGDQEIIGGELDFSDFKGGWSLYTFLDHISWSSWFS